MASEEMRTLTASEPLSLEEEYAMQESWHRDDDKLTFILVDQHTTAYTLLPGEEPERHGKPIGDVNIFLNDDDDTQLAECEIMIADPAYRGRGIGKEAMRLLLSYYKQHVDRNDARTLSVKISFNNSLSHALFTALGFEPYKRVEVFQELELRHPGYCSTPVHVTTYV